MYRVEEQLEQKSRVKEEIRMEFIIKRSFGQENNTPEGLLANVIKKKLHN